MPNALPIGAEIAKIVVANTLFLLFLNKIPDKANELFNKKGYPKLINIYPAR